MTPQQRRRSRNENIPHNFIQNWQCPGAEGARPVVRRPITACESCRAAKVKCTGPQNACDRCTTRGVPCRYTAPSTTTSSSSSRSTTASMSPSNNVDSSGSSSISHSPSTVNTPLSGPLKSTVPMTMEWEMGTHDPLRLNDESHQQDLNGVDWPKDMSSYLFDWSSLDLGHNTMDPLNTLGAGELDVFPAAAQSPLLAHQDRSTGLAPTTTTPAPSTTQGSCQCRTNLMLQVPEVHEAMQAKPHPQLDRIFKVTGNVLGACRDLIICTSCQVSYADLVCVVAVLQQTGTCFEKIANGDMTTSTIKVCVGQYEVPIANEIKLRHMLVMDLVAQANCLLSLLRNRGQSLVQSQGPAQDRLTQINIDYMQEVVKSFEQTLRSIADSLDKPASDS